MNNLITRWRSTATKATAAYAGYRTTVKVAKSAAEVVCHTWEIDREATPNSFDDAVDLLVTRHMLNPPWARAHPVTGYASEEPGGLTADWGTLRVPGVGFVQAMKDGCDVTFRTPSFKVLDGLRNYLTELEAEIEANRPAPVLDFNIQKWTQIRNWDGSEWNYSNRRRAKSFDSVVLPASVQQALQEDLRGFTESRERLARVEMPWRRGYLLSGPPGTGKTSVSLAIAAALNFNLARLPLSDIKSDGELIKAVSQLGGETVLVIEDIDAYSISHDRDHNSARDGALSLSGLLNSLDGFETPEGLVTIVTTNHIEKLDPALVRSGRLDRTFTLDYIAAAELERLFTWFYEAQPPSPAPVTTLDARLAPATVAETFKQHLNDPQAGWNAVLEAVPTKQQVMAERRLGLLVA